MMSPSGVGELPKARAQQPPPQSARVRTAPAQQPPPQSAKVRRVMEEPWEWKAEYEISPSEPAGTPTRPDELTAQALKDGLVALLPKLSMSTTVRQVREQLAQHLGLASDALDPRKEEIADLAQKVLEEQGIQATEANDAALPPKKLWRRLYNGTWSHTNDPGKKAPRDMPKAEFGALILTLLGQAFQKATEPPKKARLNQVTKASVWDEPHQNGQPHYHFPILAEGPWTYLPLQRALRQEGIYVEFSSEHDYYWTSIVYVATPSPLPSGKKEAELDQEPWLSPGHPSVRETLEDIPRGARPSDKSRVRRYLCLGEESTSASKSKDFSLTDKEFSAQLVAHGLRSTTQLLAWVASQRANIKSLAVDDRAVCVGVEAYCFKHQGDLQRRVDFAWEMHEAPHAVALKQMSAWAMIQQAAREAECVCGGQWPTLTESLLQLHCNSWPPHAPEHEKPDAASVRRAIQLALQQGCKKHNNIFLYGPNTSGKSHLLKPLAEIFAQCAFLRPVGKGNYPLQEIFGAKVCVLQDVRVSSFKLDFDALLVWFEGEKFPVPLPRNTHTKDKWYDEKAPVFISSGSKFRIPDAEARRLQVDAGEQNRMTDARFQSFHFPRSLTKHEKVECHPCPRCFARWVCEDAAVPAPALLPGPPTQQGPSPQQAAEAILDWVESHGGQLRLRGVGANVSQLADALQWSRKYVATCGRLIPFLAQHGEKSAGDPDVLVGVRLPA